MNNKQTGDLGEKIAQDYLKKIGFDIIETNYRYSKFAEIDIIALKDGSLHFIEVKTRSSDKFGIPFEAITKSKLNSIKTCANYYLSSTKVRYKNMQIDGIGIILNKNGNPEINFLENIGL